MARRFDPADAAMIVTAAAVAVFVAFAWMAARP